MTVDVRLLERFAHQGQCWALRELARCHLKGRIEHADPRRGRALLLGAAHASDRGAEWLLAAYYATGRYGFAHDPEKARGWYRRAERHLRFDACGEYDDPTLKARAVRRYRMWRHVCERMPLPP